MYRTYPSSCFRQYMSNLKFVVLCLLASSIVIPLLILCVPPLLFYRFSINLIVTKVTKRCRRMLTGTDAILASPDPYKAPAVTLSPYFTLTTRVDRDHIIRMLNEHIIDPNYYPELKERIIRILGFFFWAPCEHFNTDQHVRFFDKIFPDRPVTISELRKAATGKLANEPFDSSRSPWELVIIPNLVDNQNPKAISAIIIRVNHCLMDGFSIVNFVQKLSIQKWKLNAPQQTNRNQSSYKAISQLLKLICTGPFHLLNTLVQTDSSKYLMNALSDAKFTFIEMEPRRIDEKDIKIIRQAMNVSVSSVLLTLVIEAISDFLKVTCAIRGEPIPDTIHLFMSFPLPDHPDKMTNHWSFIRMPIKFNKDKDPIKTLRAIDDMYKSFKVSVTPLVAHGLQVLLGFCPYWLHPDLDKLPQKQTVSLGNLPGPASQIDLFGYQVESFNLGGTATKGNAFIAACHTMMGKFWIDLGGVNTLIQSPVEIHKLEEFVHNTLADLLMLVRNQN